MKALCEENKFVNTLWGYNNTGIILSHSYLCHPPLHLKRFVAEIPNSLCTGWARWFLTSHRRHKLIWKGAFSSGIFRNICKYLSNKKDTIPDIPRNNDSTLLSLSCSLHLPPSHFQLNKSLSGEHYRSIVTADKRNLELKDFCCCWLDFFIFSRVPYAMLAVRTV